MPNVPTKKEDTKPDTSMMDQILSMGYPPTIAKKALLQVNNESIMAALDAIEQIQAEESKKSKKKIVN